VGDPPVERGWQRQGEFDLSDRGERVADEVGEQPAIAEETLLFVEAMSGFGRPGAAARSCR